MASFYRSHLPKFAEISRPLYDLTKKNVPFVWGDKVQESFEFVKTGISKPILLFHPNLTKAFTIECDASSIAVAAVLKQDGRIVSMVSKALKNHELNWAIRDKELYSIVYACLKFHFYLDNKDDTTIFTDHKSLAYLKTTDLTGRLARWAMVLMPYNLNIQYVQGENNTLADSLTRLNKYFERFDKDQAMTITRMQAKSKFMNTSNIYKVHIATGHIGSEKLYDYLRNCGKNIKKEDCVLITKNCEICLLNKKNMNQSFETDAVSYGNYTFDTIGMDVIGKLLTCENNGVEYNYILTIVDYFSKWVELIPLHGLTGDETLKAINLNWISRYGRPKKIVTDLGSNLITWNLNSLCYPIILSYTFRQRGTKREMR